MENFKKTYRDLEMRVLRELRNKVENSKLISKHIQGKAIKVDILHFTELSIVNDRLVFMNRDGYQYDLFAGQTLEDLIDLIDILNS